ncbi:MAG: methionine--tRNA ligase [Abditibacteriales bacterium]|nr:methionine--tRNA ligase [Abditibacteriales bacterium]MDW8365227.1 methionine--tRNA ligase [Abditibacteriales bacterium]
MAEKIFIGVAWPYVNGDLHLGHIAGCYLPSDIFARFHRLRGNEVLMVSGSDQHGTPIAVKAEQEGKSPAEIADFYHERFLKTWAQLGISFDLYTRTGTENHARVTHAIFLNLLQKGYIQRATMASPYCPACQRFLPDRFVRGTCPRCHSPDARGDQCDRCQSLLDPTDLMDWRCGLCGSKPMLRQTEHFFLQLHQFNERLKEWVLRQSEPAHWRAFVRNETLGTLQEGLRPRAITRDLTWGVSIPIEGFEDKRIYVWFEAVIGYLSAAIEWAQRSGDAERWQHWWCDPNTKSYYFIGKDNIPFHTLIWPAMLMGINDAPAPLYASPLNLPYDVPANQHLTIEQQKFSKRRNWAIYVPDFLSRYDPDPLRYFLSVNMPETADTDFSWSEFVRRNNTELVGTYGNAVNRTLSLVSQNFQGRVPPPSVWGELDHQILAKIDEARAAAENALAACRFREGLRAAMGLAQELNVYLDYKAPWQQAKTDREGCATTLYTALQVIANLRVLFAPFLPFSSQRLGDLLGLPPLQSGDWRHITLPVGQQLQKPEILFKKLDEDIVEKELARLGALTTQATTQKEEERVSEPIPAAPTIKYDDFVKLDLRTAKVLSVDKVAGADRLYTLIIDLGSERRQIVAGVAQQFPPEDLLGKTIVVVANLEPRKVRGVESNGMLLAAVADDVPVGIITVDRDVPPGAQVR